MNLPQKTPKIYECKKCNFITSNLKDYNRHLLTRKHTNTTKYNTFTPKNPKKFECECGKVYPYRSSLYNHKKGCNYVEKKGENIDYKELFLSMLKDNKELCNNIINTQSELAEQLNNSKIENNIIGNNNIITKQKLNINIFLNEHCKDALTINEFIDKIKITLDDLIITKNKGISEGVSNIFIENMNRLSLYERPMHCTDIKREKVYIKSNDDGVNPSWKLDIENKELKEALQKVSIVQQKNLDKWTKENPNWQKDSKLQEEYMKLIKNCTDDIEENKRSDKIVKKLCNKVFVNNKLNN
tara:strand:+ start:327 stop:1223 length:897 start_codon:yes stop_codon:yes gene_type:complete